MRPERAVAAEVERLPARAVVGEHPARVQRNDAVTAGPELAVAPAPQAAGRGHVVLEHGVAVGRRVPVEQGPGRGREVPQLALAGAGAASPARPARPRGRRPPAPRRRGPHRTRRSRRLASVAARVGGRRGAVSTATAQVSRRSPGRRRRAVAARRRPRTPSAPGARFTRPVRLRQAAPGVLLQPGEVVRVRAGGQFRQPLVGPVVDQRCQDRVVAGVRRAARPGNRRHRRRGRRGRGRASSEPNAAASRPHVADSFRPCRHTSRRNGQRATASTALALASGDADDPDAVPVVRPGFASGAAAGTCPVRRPVFGHRPASRPGTTRRCTRSSRPGRVDAGRLDHVAPEAGPPDTQAMPRPPQRGRTRPTTCQCFHRTVAPCVRGYGASGRTVRTTRNPL